MMKMSSLFFGCDREVLSWEYGRKLKGLMTTDDPFRFLCGIPLIQSDNQPLLSHSGRFRGFTEVVQAQRTSFDQINSDSCVAELPE